MNAILNLLWIGVAVSAVGAFVLSEWRSRPGALLRARGRRALAVSVVVIALFPTVSASDDFVRLVLLPASVPSQKQQIAGEIAAGSSQTPALYLARLSRIFENSQVSWPLELALTVTMAMIFGAWFSKDRDLFLSPCSSRAPPHPFFAA
ncbi:MAG TPA: hypothetical protein VFZ08_17105 [Terriglobia bacterium]|nr:hypothetical protein [Terriglobia bacterium]